MAWIDPYEHFRDAANRASNEFDGPALESAEGRLAMAPVQKRLLASAIDLALFRLAGVLLAMLWFWLDALHFAGNVPMHGGVPLTIVVLFDGAALLFFGPLTWRQHGQSPGKRFVGLRVVTQAGQPAPLHALLIRETLWRAVPLLVLPLHVLPSVLDAGLLAVGAIALLLPIGPDGEPFYDQLAGTQVVLEAPI